MDDPSSNLNGDTGAPDLPTDTLDCLIDLIGELVIASASASLLAQRSGQSVLAEANSVVSHLVDGIRDAALKLRMVKIGATFEQVQAAAAVIAGELGKEFELTVSGGDTDLDKSMVEKLGEPLVRLVRNALEHGIESAADRLAAGKPAAGQIALRAFHDSASIVIELVDDGAPLNAETLRAQAAALGLVQEDHAAADEGLLNLLFEPGFPGRGAGLDAVKEQLTALRGAVTVHSAPEEGTRFSIRLPLTLAIIDGFLTGVEKSSYVIPLDSVVECLELSNASVDRDYMNLRGEVLPYVRLRELFDVPGDTPARENVVVVHYDGRRAGIVVDQLLGEFQTVIKPLGTLFRHIHGIGGSTILGSGEVALILDVQALVSHSAALEGQREARHTSAGRSLELQ